MGGTCAGLLSVFVSQPFDVMKTRGQSFTNGKDSLSKYSKNYPRRVWIAWILEGIDSKNSTGCTRSRYYVFSI